MVALKRTLPFSALVLLIMLGTSPQLCASEPSSTNLPEVSTLRPSLVNFQLQQRTLHQAITLTGTREAGPIAFGSATLLQDNEPKSKGRAFLQSLIFPGWGQYYAQSRTMTKAFVASEALLWGTYVGFSLWGNWLEDDYRTFAVTHADIDLNGKSSAYFVDIGNFDDIFEYNQAQLRDRDVSDLYPETERFSWNWDNAENRRRFEDMRVRSDRARNRADLTLAAIFLNHLVSAIHSTLAVHRYNQSLTGRDLGLRFDFDVDSLRKEIRFGLVKQF